MELRHLRYFVAVAEEASLTVAAKNRLHTAQPSLSRQMQDLEATVGVQLLIRSARGVELTAAGRTFLDHARLTLAQAEAAIQAARRAAYPAKPTFALGFLAGQEVDWLPHVTCILSNELPNIEIRVLSQHSAQLLEDLQRRKLDVAFLRPDPKPDIEYRILTKEPLVAILPGDHRLAARKAIDAHDLVGETFIAVSETARVLRGIINAYLQKNAVKIMPRYEIDTVAMGISLVSTTRGIALLPAYAENFLTRSVVSRPLKGEAPTIDLAIGYHKENTSPVLKAFLSRVDDLIARFAAKGSVSIGYRSSAR